MRLIHNVDFSLQEIEFFRQLVFNNLNRGLEALLDAMDDMELSVSEENQIHPRPQHPSLYSSSHVQMRHLKPGATMLCITRLPYNRSVLINRNALSFAFISPHMDAGADEGPIRALLGYCTVLKGF